MKVIKNMRSLFLVFIVAALLPYALVAQTEEAEKSSLSLTLRYFCEDNKLPYLTVVAKTKVEGKFRPLKGAEVKLYLTDVSDEANLIGKVTTNDNGTAKAPLPTNIQEAWKASEKHTLIAVADATDKFEEAEATIEITKSRITIDTLFDGETKSVVVTVHQLENGAWIPAPDVEVKVGITRIGVPLPVGESESYTTDSSGQAVAEFARLDLPGDEKGNLMLIAEIQDHDALGNISATFQAPWGKPTVNDVGFFERTLWGSRSNAPFWLIGASNLIIALVWGVLFYIVFQIFKIRNLGKKDKMIEQELKDFPLN